MITKQVTEMMWNERVMIQFEVTPREAEGNRAKFVGSRTLEVTNKKQTCYPLDHDVW
jgi:hypothetical protein